MNIKKLVAGVMACCVVGGTLPYVVGVVDNAVITANAEDYTNGTYEQLTYKNYGDYIEISGCDKEVTEVVIPAEIDGLPVTSMGFIALGFCKNLTSVTIPNSITQISIGAFHFCSSLVSVTIPDSVTSISGGAFVYCESLTSINVSENNKNYLSIDGVLFNKDKTTLIRYPEGKTEKEYVFPNNIKNIGDRAFVRCSALTSITIPDSVTSIGDRAFEDCSGLTSITILNPECEIYDSASVISDTATIYGYNNSTAQAYAEKYGYTFESLGEAPENSVTATLLGDANCDGNVNMSDATAIIQHIGNKDKYALDTQGLANADANADGAVTASDAIAIQLLVAKQITELPYIEE